MKIGDIPHTHTYPEAELHWIVRCTLLVFLGLAIVGCRQSGPKQQPPVSPASLMSVLDPEVIPKPYSIPEGENGWLIYGKAMAAFGGNKVPDGVVAYPVLTDDAQASLKKLKPLSGALDQLIQASEKKAWVLPKRDILNVDNKPESMLRDMVKCLCARGQARIFLGQSADGARDIIAARKAGLALMNGHGLMLDGIIGNALIAIADRTIERCCADPKSKREVFQLLLDSIPEAFAVDDAMQETLRTEVVVYQMPYIATMPDPVFDNEAFKKATASPFEPEGFADLALIGKNLNSPFDRKDTVQALSKGYAMGIRNLGHPWSQQESIGAYSVTLLKGWPSTVLDRGKVSDSDKAKAQKDLADSSDAVGKLVAASSLILLPEIIESSFRWRTHQEAVRAVLAMRIWRSQHGNALPLKLDQLVSAGIIKHLPRDLYGDGAPLHYDAARAILWSVGKDGVDDGGNDRPRQVAGAKDYVWSATGD